MSGENRMLRVEHLYIRTLQLQRSYTYLKPKTDSLGNVGFVKRLKSEGLVIIAKMMVTLFQRKSGQKTVVLGKNFKKTRIRIQFGI